jgi:hypothetical protein
MRQRINLRRLRPLINIRQTSKCVGAIDIHRTAPTDALTAGTTEGQGGVLFVFDFEEGVKDHGAAAVFFYVCVCVCVCVF